MNIYFTIQHLSYASYFTAYVLLGIQQRNYDSLDLDPDETLIWIRDTALLRLRLDTRAPPPLGRGTAASKILADIMAKNSSGLLFFTQKWLQRKLTFREKN